MKAIRVHSPGGVDALQLEDLPIPQPGPGEVRVRARAIGVGKPDTLIRQGTYRWMPALPAIPGNEMAGEIDALGPSVDSLRIGERVLVSSRELSQRGGCYAQYICVPADTLYSLPAQIDPFDAVSLPNYQLAGALLHVATGGWRANSILIHGAAGGVATALIQVARSDGATVIGTASTAGKCAFALANGANHVIDYTRENVAQRVREITSGAGVDLVLDHVGGPKFTANLDLLAPLGMIVSYNALGGMPDVELFSELRRLVGRSLAVRCFSIHTLDSMPALRRRLMEQAIEGVAGGLYRPPAPTILPLADARRAHELLERTETLGKLVLNPD